MATTTPVYGWPVPTSSDLVKNGATAIEALGDAADATMATMVPKSLVDAKGDLIAATAADTVARLAVGTNGQTLVADSTTATGLKWASASSGFNGALARNSSLQSIPNATWTAVIMDTEIFDSGTYWDTGANTRFTIPTTGKYSISSQALSTSTGSACYMAIYKNGSAFVNVETRNNPNSSTMGRTTVLSLTASDYVQLYVFQNQGSAANYVGDTSDTGCMQWSITFLGA
jgi:hypothetical protein